MTITQNALSVQHIGNSPNSDVGYYSIPLATVTSVNGFIGSGGSYGLSYSTQDDGQGQVKRIGPKLFFSYVKSKLNKSEQKKLKSRMSKLQALVKQAEDLGQEALYQELGKMLAIVVRESEAVACGYDTYIDKAIIEKFMGMVKENDESKQKIVYLKKLEEFPRAIPTDIRKVIKDAQKKGVFDELWVLYLDYTNDSQAIKSNKEKIRQKDPILFGRFAYDPNKFFYLADWVDEFCDLTLSKFVDTVKASNPEYEVSEVADIDEVLIERIKKEVKERHDRLNATNAANFRQLMADEDKKKQPAKRWYEFWK